MLLHHLPIKISITFTRFYHLYAFVKIKKSERKKCPNSPITHHWKGQQDVNITELSGRSHDNFLAESSKLSGQAPDSGISHRKKENSVTTSIWIINAGLTITLLKNSALGKGDINWLFEHIVLLLVTKGHLFSHIFFILECALGLQLIHSRINF